MKIAEPARAAALASAAAGKDSGLPTVRQTQLAEQYAARAVAVLKLARAAGVFKNPGQVAHMRQDTDLDALRRRPDYRRLVAELASADKAGGK